MEIKKIFVAGAGLMGGGIAQVFTQAGYQVTMHDVTDEILKKSLKTVAWSVGKLVEKGKAAGTVAEIMGRLNWDTWAAKRVSVGIDMMKTKKNGTCLAKRKEVF